MTRDENKKEKDVEKAHNIRVVDCPQYGCPIYPIELPIIERRYSKNYNGNDDKSYYAALTQKGQDHVVNQDRGIIHVRKSTARDDEKSHQNKSRNEDGQLYFSMGVFDGHGDEGHKVAHHLQQHLFPKLDSKLRFQKKEDIVSALNETFLELDRELDSSIGNNGGSTAAIVLHRRRSSSSSATVLYFASVGDSLCVLFDKKGGDIIFQTKYDRVHFKEEQDRILGMEGKIHTPPKHPKQARSVAWSVKKGEMVSLAMSRSIGDWEHLGVIAMPHVDVVELPSSERERRGFIVACGSDGIFESRRPEFVVRQLAEYGVNRTAHLIDLATPRNPKAYRDDITLMALQIGN
eukprot:CAMPEP_0194313018 /NCGR_PEP_ID=MMETSP0171-20130528/9911_1 /TAXON_ID=218684 /ORGANISM="Corethron pennatum, Strain L29A3" /LENGTH=347 /DNA_ID=CAMNT_0039067777 /DNA_START=204 /DNA_END=1247 /DNA_ORIENTATION=+